MTRDVNEADVWWESSDYHFASRAPEIQGQDTSCVCIIEMECTHVTSVSVCASANGMGRIYTPDSQPRASCFFRCAETNGPPGSLKPRQCINLPRDGTGALVAWRESQPCPKSSGSVGFGGAGVDY